VKHPLHQLRKRRHFGPKYRLSTPTRSEKEEKHVWKTHNRLPHNNCRGKKTHTHPHVQSREDRFTNLYMVRFQGCIHRTRAAYSDINPQECNSKRSTYHQWCALPTRRALVTHSPYTLPRYTLLLQWVHAIAKHAALHNYGHDEAFPPPSPDGNPFAYIYGSQKRKIRLLTLPLKSTLHHYKTLRTN